MKLTLKIWRQASANEAGALVAYLIDDADPDMSFLEVLDVLNERLTMQGERPIAFDHDCREGICGSCGFMVNGIAHGRLRLTTVCQLFMRYFSDGETLTVEPFRARALPVIQDLVVDRRALDRIIEAGGFIAARTGSAPEANSILVSREAAERAMDAAACIGCAACAAACPNASAMLFTAAKISHLGLLPQGQPERHQRAKDGPRDDRPGFRKLHQSRRVRSGLPEGDQPPFHRPFESRLPESKPVHVTGTSQKRLTDLARTADNHDIRDFSARVLATQDPRSEVIPRA